MEIQLEFIKKKRSGQSLIEIVVAIALAAFFMGSTIVGLGFSSTRYSGYVQKKQAFDILKKQKSSNEVNLGRFLSQYKNISGYSSLNAFPYQGAHQTYTYLNYLTDNQSLSAFLNEEKKFFDNDKPIGYWSLDAIPTSTTYILDDSGKTSLKGTLTCLGSPCNNPYVISPSLGRCVHNDCMQFTGDSNGGSVVTFEDNTTLNNMKKITWEAWVYPTSVATDQIFLSKQGNNYFRISNSKAYASFSIGGVQKTLTGNTTLYNNTWYHLVASFDGARVRLYVNGIQDATPLVASGDLSFDTGLLYFGLYTSADRRPLIGSMDEIRVYNYALVDKEVKNHYKAFREKIGLLGYWSFDDALGVGTFNAINSIGTDLRFNSYSIPDNLTIYTEKVSALNSDLVCKSGSCLGFNGSYASKGTFTDSGNNYPLFHAPGRITLEMLINPSSVAGTQGLVTKNSYNNYKVYLDGPSIVFSLKIGGTQFTETYAAGLVPGQWYLLDFTYDGTNMILYINGELKQSWTHSGTISNDVDFNDIYLGWTGSGVEYFNGYMDEFRIYNRALSLEEINGRYDGGYTYYQYFKPVCKVDNINNVLDTECLNCLPINASECQTVKTHSTLDPLQNKVVDVIKWGGGINPSKIEIKQIITPLMSVQHSDIIIANEGFWSSGVGLVESGTCKEFWGNGGRTDFAGPEHCASGISDCCNYDFIKLMDNKVCSASNISFYHGNGCSSCGYTNDLPWCTTTIADGYFKMTDPNSASGEFISQTYALSGKISLLAFGWRGVSNMGGVKMQLACLDSITDANGDLLPDTSWVFLGPDTNTARCSETGYYDVGLLPGKSFPISSCWETDNQTAFNCNFFRYKIKLEPSGGHISPIINDVYFYVGRQVQ